MGTKIFFTGLALLFALPRFFNFTNLDLVAAAVIIIGIILIWLDR